MIVHMPRGGDCAQLPIIANNIFTIDELLLGDKGGVLMLIVFGNSADHGNPELSGNDGSRGRMIRMRVGTHDAGNLASTRFEDSIYMLGNSRTRVDNRDVIGPHEVGIGSRPSHGSGIGCHQPSNPRGQLLNNPRLHWYQPTSCVMGTTGSTSAS